MLAVVTVGLFEAMAIKKNTLFDAKAKDLSNSTWKVINTVLNAIVFLYLGDRMPTILEEANALNNSGILKYILVILIATFMLFLIRFLLLIIYKIYKDGIKRSIKIKDQFILTLVGVKGTVTLATITSLPFSSITIPDLKRDP